MKIPLWDPKPDTLVQYYTQGWLKLPCVGRTRTQKLQLQGFFFQDLEIWAPAPQCEVCWPLQSALRDPHGGQKVQYAKSPWSTIIVLNVHARVGRTSSLTDLGNCAMWPLCSLHTSMYLIGCINVTAQSTTWGAELLFFFSSFLHPRRTSSPSCWSPSFCLSWWFLPRTAS